MTDSPLIPVLLPASEVTRLKSQGVDVKPYSQSSARDAMTELHAELIDLLELMGNRFPPGLYGRSKSLHEALILLAFDDESKKGRAA